MQHIVFSLLVGLLLAGCTSSPSAEPKAKHVSTMPQVKFSAKDGTESLIVPAFTKSNIVDTDHDGIGDNIDTCEETPIGVDVDIYGCAYDRDQDGVKDYEDECQNSMAHATVKANGCSDFFSFNLYYAPRVNSITPKSMLVLEKAVGFLSEHPEYKLKIIGHTDNVGDADYNLKLSKERAAEVLKLFNRKGINFNRLESTGMGEANPRGDNNTDEGRQMNRRIEIELYEDLK